METRREDEARSCDTRLVQLNRGGGGGGGGLSFLEKLAKSTTLLCPDQWQANETQLQAASQRVAVLESTIASQQRELTVLKHQTEAERSKNALFEEQLRQLSEERTHLAVQNTKFAAQLHTINQVSA
ncbi:unnamed protein product [Echinostoma caproni]|uniref:Uncharacterized protein n=1 Tax=Echinostoma caproni TaxID=27848 RepID=A0A183ADE8_9TREM|nr:unnamed protein product [Echinostoma caproni]